MTAFIVKYLWLIPALPLVSAAVLSLLREKHRSLAPRLAVGAMGIGFLLSLIAFVATLGDVGRHQPFNFDWMSVGDTTFQMGWVLDPLTAAMLMMVTFVGALIFIFSVGYMEHDERFLRFFCFLSLFAAAMLGLIIANNLLLLFMCWELVGLASYLLIGFWFEKPSAAAAAKKAFMTTRIGDLGFLIGIVWLYQETGTLLFYTEDGTGCLEFSALSSMVTTTVGAGMIVSTAISLLIFCGAIGKSGQLPLHVWLPDAMEGPTPVSALIHAATMVAAGVFLMARIYPMMEFQPEGVEEVSTVLHVITWIGALTALFAAVIAVAQFDIKRILAYSTVSQLGYMFIGLGTGGVGVAMFHLLTHACFKALLFLGAGSVIHGCHHEQDIRKMGGIRRFMPVTFATYTIGMLALAGFPLFAGFWSKDEILHSAHGFEPGQWPFYIGLVGAFLTAFYMTRQMFYVFVGEYRGVEHERSETKMEALAKDPHESPKVMTTPLVVLAGFALVLGLFSTPLYPWLESYLEGHHAEFSFSELVHALPFMLLSSLIVGAGLILGWWYYGLVSHQTPEDPDVLVERFPRLFAWLNGRFFVDELYALSVIRWAENFARFCDWVDRRVLSGIVYLTGLLTAGIAWLARFTDEFLVNGGFDRGCRGLKMGGGRLGGVQNGQVQSYLRVFGVTVVLIVLLLAWGGSR